MPRGITRNRYYIVVLEWLYPTESGKEVLDETYDSRVEAIEACKESCEKERSNFDTVCGDSVISTEYRKSKTVKGHILTTKTGLDEWFFYAKVISVKYGD